MNHSTTFVSTLFISSKTSVFDDEKCLFGCGFYPSFSRLKFTGKELDPETGFGYFGARYMDYELMTGFISVDRYADKYPSLSPYHYCAWNPIKLIDPTGDTVIIQGTHSNRVVNQLQTGNMNVLRSESGVLSVDLLPGFTRDDLSKEERRIYDAIKSTKVKIVITALKSTPSDGKHKFSATVNGKTKHFYSDGGGSNMGSYYNPNSKTATSYGFIDMDLLESKGYDQGVAHEVSEYFIAGLIAIRDGANVSMAIQGVTNPRMMEAHVSAIPEKLPEGNRRQFGVKFGYMGTFGKQK